MKIITQIEKQKTIFDNIYNKHQAKEYKYISSQEAFSKRVFRNLNFQKGDRFLDIGLGLYPHLIIEAIKLGVDSIGIDISDVSLKNAMDICRKVFLKERNVPTFLSASAQALPFKNNNFNKISSLAVMEHLENDEAAFDEIARVCAPNGIVHICVPNTYLHIPFWLGIINIINDKKLGHLRHYNPNDLIRQFEKRGFRKLNLEYHGHYIKLLSLFCTLLPFKFKDKLVSYFDNIDDKLSNNQNSINFSVTIEKIK